MPAVPKLNQLPSLIDVFYFLPCAHGYVCDFFENLNGNKSTQAPSSSDYTDVLSYILSIFIVIGAAGYCPTDIGSTAF
ncbi:hypothetical protein G6011_00307 [Alternaria panax]|uniref:Uncharacterized protein n=1 Tax=Alternaria panax TaxID=48097 RepID=A0AAD4NUL5_9PLEO|nr:hypothetical protein G6011_00307 [Alternaria panax]